MELRDYQLKAVEAIERELLTARSTLLVLPTGAGKTICLAHVIARTAGRTLVIAHREELVRQAAEKIGAVLGEQCEIEMANERADLHIYKRARCVVASKDSLQGGRLARFDPAEFSLVVTDEGHHSVAKRYGNIYSHFAGAKLLGVTATPDRMDEEALGKVYETVAFNYEIPDAINDGWLVPIMQRSVFVESLDFSGVKTTAGDLNQKQLSQIMESEKMLHEIVTPTLELGRGKKQLVFTASVRHAEMCSHIFNRHEPGSTRWVCGETPKDERASTLRDYRDNKFRRLVNVGVYTEGFDEPSIDMVVVARPTESRSLYAQMVGRGTRPLAGVVDAARDSGARRTAIAASRKPTLEVIDFEGNAGRHKLVTTADILGGNYSDEVVARVKSQTRDVSKTFSVDTSAALREAERKLAEEHEERRKAQIKAMAAAYTTNTIDPFDVLQLEPCRERGWDAAKKPTEKMIALLEKHGIDAKNLSMKRASQLIHEVLGRRGSGRCTYKQASVLIKHGYDPNVTFEAATAIITEITQNKFRKGAA